MRERLDGKEEGNSKMKMAMIRTKRRKRRRKNNARRGFMCGAERSWSGEQGGIESYKHSTHL